MAAFSFGQVEAVLANLNDIADHKRVAFAGRLKFLQRNGIASRAGGKQGKAGTYNFSDLMKLAVGIELMKCGLPPALAASIVVNNWVTMRPTVYLGTFSDMEVAEAREGTDREGEARHRSIWLVRHNALSDLTVDGASEFDQYEAVDPVSVEELGDVIEGIGIGDRKDGRHMLMINGDALARRVLVLVAYKHRFAGVDEMRQDLQDEVDAFERMMSDPKLTVELTEEQRAKIKARLRDALETDYSLNPPVSGTVMRHRAVELLRQLSQSARDTLSEMEKTWEGDAGKLTISENVRSGLSELIDYGIIEAGDQGQFLVAPLGVTAMKLLRTSREASDGNP